MHTCYPVYSVQQPSEIENAIIYVGDAHATEIKRFIETRLKIKPIKYYWTTMHRNKTLEIKNFIAIINAHTHLKHIFYSMSH